MSKMWVRSVQLPPWLDFHTGVTLGEEFLVQQLANCVPLTDLLMMLSQKPIPNQPRENAESITRYDCWYDCLPVQYYPVKT